MAEKPVDVVKEEVEDSVDVVCFGSDLALKTIITYFLVFFKKSKKVINCQKRHFYCFLKQITFFPTFSKILTKRPFVPLLFQKLKHKKNY